MAWKIGSNTVIDGAATVPFSTITGKPAGFVETVTVTGAGSWYKASYGSSTLTFTKVQMAIFQGSTQVVTNTPAIDWGRLSGLPAGVITNLNVTSIGDTTNPIGTAGVRVDTVSLTAGTLNIRFNTDCACACLCLCQCGS